MTDAHLTDELARLIGWRPFPNRFVTIGRDWISRSRFQPLTVFDHAFDLLESVTKDYSIENTPAHGFSVEVRLPGRIGRAAGEPKARTITLAIAGALKLDVAGCERVVTTNHLKDSKAGRKSQKGQVG